MLVSNAAHGLSTGALDGTGEITLRDAVVVAAASLGAKLSKAWLILREQTPVGWSGADVDVVLARKAQAGPRWVVGVELKWWRRADAANAANRRRELVRDFLRCAALYKNVEAAAFVALLATDVSWQNTTDTDAGDREPMKRVRGSGEQHWDVAKLIKSSPAVKGAASDLFESVPLVSAFKSKLECSASVTEDGKERASARVWRVWKHQNTTFLGDEEVADLGIKKKNKKKKGKKPASAKKDA